MDGGEASGANGYVDGFAVDLCFFVCCEAVGSDSAVSADYHVCGVCYVAI